MSNVYTKSLSNNTQVFEFMEIPFSNPADISAGYFFALFRNKRGYQLLPKPYYINVPKSIVNLIYSIVPPSKKN